MIKIFETRHNPNDSVVGKYYIETDGDLYKTAEKIAREETAAKWVGLDEETELHKRCVGEVWKISEKGKGKGIIEILLPLENMNLEVAPFPNLWLYLTGGPVFEFCEYKKVRLLDFELPEVFLRKFPGPKWGIKKTKEFLEMKKGEVIIGTIVKPCAGLTADEVAKKCYEAAVGGVRFIKDDEKMTNPNYCPLEEKVKKVVEMLKRAEDKTGQKVIYAPHITTSPDKIKDTAKRVIELGATAVMFNFFASGFESLRIIAEDPDINVPIYAHSGGRSAWSRVKKQGIDDVVTAKLVRLLGGDYFQIGVVGGYLLPDTKTLVKLAKVFRKKMGKIKDTVPVTAGGIDSSNVGENIKHFGTEIMVLAGTAILNHPKGIKAGVEELKSAAEAVK